MRKTIIFIGLIVIVGFGRLSVDACMCPGVNPDVYPPDVEKSREYYKKEFKGAAFTGRVLSSRESPDVLLKGERVVELTVEIDRYWFGIDRRSVTVYTPRESMCWAPFLENESYFFIPSLQEGRYHIEICAYATFNRKYDGNYAAFMVKMFGKGKRVRPER